MKKALVTGASGFLGSEIVKELLARDYQVRAGCYSNSPKFSGSNRPEVIRLDLGERESVMNAVKGADVVFHCGALVDSGMSRAALNRINVEGSKMLWECMAEQGVRKGLYCSSAAVYGLLCAGREIISEKTEARAIEPYGRSKLEGEKAVLKISERAGIETVIIRPVAIFGPGEHTPFGRALSKAAVSKILIAGGFRNKSFSFVQVKDVAKASVFLTEIDGLPGGEVFNVCAESPVKFEDAFEAYIRVLNRGGKDFVKVKMLALISKIIQKIPESVLAGAGKIPGKYLFGIWHPGFDLVYSSEKIRSLGFRFGYNNFEEVFMTCLEKV